MKHPRNTLLLAALMLCGSWAWPAAAETTRNDEPSQSSSSDELDWLFSSDQDQRSEDPQNGTDPSSADGGPAGGSQTATDSGPDARETKGATDEAEPLNTIEVGKDDDSTRIVKPPPKRRAVDEIVVTATKRETDVRDIAGSVSALIGEQLEDAGIVNVEQITEAVPGVNLVETGSNEASSRRSITIRGISADNRQSETVGIFIDETPLTDPFLVIATADANPFDMATVEVLKGPVGTLFGGSSLNGAIRYIPNKPQYEEWSAKGFAELRSFEHGGMEPVFGAAANIPVPGRSDMALRLTGVETRIAGWVDNENPSFTERDYNPSNQRSLRAQFAWQPREDLDFGLMWLSQDTTGYGYALTSASRAGRYESTAEPQQSYATVGYDTLQLTGSWTNPLGELIFIASGSNKYVDGYYDATHQLTQDSPTSLLVSLYRGGGRVLSQELRLVSGTGGRWDWLIGLYNYNYALDIYGEASAGNALAESTPDALLNLLVTAPTSLLVTENGANASRLFVKGDVAEQSAFGETTWHINDSLDLTGGLRVYRFSYDAVSIFNGPLAFVTDPVGAAASGGTSNLPIEKTENGFSPKLSIKWQPLEELMAYATVARGFRFGGVNNIAHPEVPRVFESDALWSAETGMRAQWFDASLVTDITLFAIDWKNAQFNTFTSDGLYGYTDNVGRVEGRGVEGQLVWATPLEGLSLSLTAAHADIKTAEEFTAPNGATTPKDTPWPKAPKWQTMASLSYERAMLGARWRASLAHNYFGEARQILTSDSQIFGYATYGLQLTVKPDNTAWPSLALNVNNLTGVIGRTTVHDAPNGEPDYFAYTPPRNISLRATWNFDQ